MKKTQFIDTIITIKHSFSSFLAITLFIFLSITIFFGNGWASSAIKASVENYFTESNLYDYEITFPLGVTSKDLQNLSLESSNITSGVLSFDELFDINGESFNAKLHTITTDINTLSVVSGSLPENSNEIAIDSKSSEDLNLKVGDTVSFYGDNSYLTYILNSVLDGTLTKNTLTSFDLNESVSFLSTQEFTITAIVDSPLYITRVGLSRGNSSINSEPLDAIFFVTEEAINSKFNNFYSNVYVKNSQNVKENLSDNSDAVSKIQIEYLKTFIESDLPEIKTALNRLSQFNDSYVEVLENIESFESYASKIRDNEEVLYPTVLTNDSHYAYTYTRECTKIIDNLKYVLAVVFVVLGLLVCFATISRMVFDNKVEIGTKNALGIRKKEILIQFLFIVFLSWIIAVIPAAVCSYLIERLFVSVLGSVGFTIKLTCFTFNFPSFCAFCFVLFALLELITALCVSVVLKKRTLDLLSGVTNEDIKPLKIENTKIFKKLSLWNQIIIKNLLHDKRRVFATIVSIAGITMLLVGSLTMRFNLMDGLTIQTTKYYHFDYYVTFEESDENTEKLREIFDNFNVPSALISKGYGEISNEDYSSIVCHYTVFSENPSELLDFDLLDGEFYDYNKPVFVESAEKYHKIKNNTKFDIISSTGEKGVVTISNFYKNYVDYPIMFMGKDSFVEIFGSEPSFNTFIINTRNCDFESLCNELESLGFVNDIYSYTDSIKDDIETIEAVSLLIFMIYLIASLVIAILVLYNLIYTHISERKYELLTLMINGFMMRKAKKYIYLDTIFLSIISLILGAFSGNLLGNIAAFCFQGEYYYLGYHTNWKGILLGILISSVFVIVTSLITLSRIDKFKLIEINKK